MNKLKTALDYSDRKLREYQHQLDQAGTALLGDTSHFKQILEEKRKRPKILFVKAVGLFIASNCAYHVFNAMFNRY